MSSDSAHSERPMSDNEAVAALNQHAIEAAERTLAALGGKLDGEKLETFLSNRTCLRLPTELCFDGLGLDAHQFANPDFLTENGVRRCLLHIRSQYEVLPDTHAYIVAYMTAAINYGAAASEGLCEQYGAILMGMTVDDFYAAICRIADL